MAKFESECFPLLAGASPSEVYITHHLCDARELVADASEVITFMITHACEAT